MRRPISSLLLFLTLSLGMALGGCGSEPKGEPGQKTIGVTLLSQSQDFYKDLEQGLRAEAAKVGYRVIVQSAEFDPAIQARQLEDFITKRVDAIVICPCDSDAVAASLRPVAKAGIPIFTADIAAKGAKVVAHVASDNAQGGRLAGETLAKLLGGQGKVMIIDHPTVSSVQDRTGGFEEALKAHPGMSIVARPSGDGQRAKAQSVMEDALTSYPDLAGVFGINDDSALGALRAVEASGRTGIVIIGYDATPEARAAIQRGSALKADVIQHPDAIGSGTIRAIQRHFAGETLEPWIAVDVGIVDKAALDAK
jgi:ribose transport system substrate-binding protein